MSGKIRIAGRVLAGMLLFAMTPVAAAPDSTQEITLSTRCPPGFALNKRRSGRSVLHLQIEYLCLYRGVNPA